MDDKHSLAKMREKSESVRAALAKLKESRAGVGSKEGAALSRSMSPVPESPATPPRAAMIANRRKARRASITELVGADLRAIISPAPCSLVTLESSYCDGLGLRFRMFQLLYENILVFWRISRKHRSL